MNRGFILIELLAVIVILAIIALIATPIVLNIINETKDSAGLRSAEMYLDSVEHAIANEILSGNLKTKEYQITFNGNLCRVVLDENGACSEVNEVKIVLKGEKPNSGSIKIENGKIIEAKILLNDKKIEQTNEDKLVYVDKELKYTIGEEVIFNPGDGNKIWNVIDEDVTKVTLMLSENLGNTVEWYNNLYDNSYGPKHLLEYLNSLTTEWINVDPIESYIYINNLNGTVKPYGYQKLEIKDGETTLTNKEATIITKVDGISRARILTKEEVFQIAKKTNMNLTEENLREFIKRNLSELNKGLGTTLTTVDDVLEYIVKLDGLKYLQYLSKYLQTYYTVLEMINKYGIESTYDILLPNYIYQNLYSDKVPYAYWTISTYPEYSGSAWGMRYDGNMGVSGVPDNSSRGIRPIITVSKSKLVQN